MTGQSPTESQPTGSGGLTALLIGVFLLILCSLPPLTVESATRSDRTAWFGFLAMLGLVGIFGGAAATMSAASTKSSYRKGYFTLPGTIFLLLFTATVVLSISIANLGSNASHTATFARLLTRLVEPVFPWISNFRISRMDWGLTDVQILKTEGMMSLWFAFAELLTILGLTRQLSLTRKQKEYERVLDDEANAMLQNKEQSGFVVFFAVLFAVWVSVSQVNGWMDFDHEFTMRLCVVKVLCYYQNDLLLIVAAAMKCLAIFGFPLGAAVMVRDFFRQRL